MVCFCLSIGFDFSLRRPLSFSFPVSSSAESVDRRRTNGIAHPQRRHPASGLLAVSSTVGDGLALPCLAFDASRVVSVPCIRLFRWCALLGPLTQSQCAFNKKPHQYIEDRHKNGKILGNTKGRDTYVGCMLVRMIWFVCAVSHTQSARPYPHCGNLHIAGFAWCRVDTYHLFLFCLF